MNQGALFNLKVLDLGHYIAGPYCTKLMADMGAEVIKVEKPGTGDGARRLGPFPDDFPDPEKSGLFLYLNTNKKSITLNLKTEMGRKILERLVQKADILVENFEPRVMPALGLEYQVLEKLNPGLVMTSITNFGQTGPYRDYKAVEINIAALGGSMYITGNPERQPLKEPASVFQFAAGADACGASLTAHYYRRRTGMGQHVDLSIMESIIACLSPHPLTQARTGILVKRKGPDSAATNFPGGVGGNAVYPCKDGYVAVCIRNAEDAVLSASLTGIDEMLSPEIQVIGYGKAVQDDRLRSLLLQGFQRMTKEEIFQKAQSLRLFWTSVKDIKEIMEWDHYQARGVWVSIDHPRTGRLTYARSPILMSESPTRVGRAPLLGEHNEEIYSGRLNYSKEELKELRALNVI